jgi:ATP-dependent exoDNAse (exonuclease V) beta subunit
MPSVPRKNPPPDQAQRELALDPRRSVLVRAPAGSGKTTLLAERFLGLLTEVDEPGQLVAITFTNAAAAEMRNRILDDLRGNSPSPVAQRALQRSADRGWNLLDLPAQLRIQTIDSFCRDLALQQPLLSGLSGSLDISDQPTELYLSAARRTLEQIGQGNAPLSAAIETLLKWRDNNWREIEDLTVGMLENRDRWMQDFVLEGEQDWDLLRARLELPFRRAGDSGVTGYTNDEWQIVRACFTLLRHAAAELRVVFAESAAADFTEVAQIALNVLKGEDGLLSDAAIAVADGIRHLLVDEFQDTSRRQHDLLRHLIAAWPERVGRTCFVVGDPMQSIYFFRDADAELFPRVEQLGLEIPSDLPLVFDPVHLTANFRSEHALVADINDTFERVFQEDDGSGISYTRAEAARGESETAGLHLAVASIPRMQLHLEFIPDSVRSADPGRKKQIVAGREAAQQKQIDEIVELIRSHQPRINASLAANERKGGDEKKLQYRVAVLARARKSLVPIATALRKASIPFRAIELEELESRPETIDALALARALLNPHDRVAWLGVLRAPWCGLSLADLHTLVSADDPELLGRAVPELLAGRMQLLSEEGRPAIERVLRATDFAKRLRSSQPTATPGTWLEQVWLHLGGAQCVGASARANLDLLWRTFDNLPQGEPDLLGSAVDAALKDLKALADPAASSDCGVQLMTIHGAKGLEFEVVIVPDLHVSPGHGKPGMLSWLERGIPPEAAESEPVDSREITEFLVAPFSPKGSDPGKAKKWVDRQRREREKQESRRLLYVAATRAREELHLFARPSYKTVNGVPTEVAEPRESLLLTAWPAFETEIRRRFEDWSAAAASAAGPSTIESLAASAADDLWMASPAASPALLRRLPASYLPVTADFPSPAVEEPLLGAGRLYQRHEGGLLSRALGLAVHELLQQCAQLLVWHTPEAARKALARQQPRIAAVIRAVGVEPRQASRMAALALQITLKAARDPVAQWILAPHADAANEVRWTGVAAGSLRTVQVDRVFRAGPVPKADGGSAGDNTWWIVDYKTAHEDGLDPAAALPELREIFAPQIEAYAKVLRNLRGGDINLRGGLYYPRMSAFDWWELSR